MTGPRPVSAVRADWERHEHEWSAWKTEHAAFRRPGEPVREGRYCTEWACDTTEIRPAAGTREDDDG